MPLTEIKTVNHDGKEISRVERKLYTLAELKEGTHLEGQDIVPAHEAGAFDRACENIGRMMDEGGWSQFTLEADISEYIVPDILGKAGITTDPKTIEWDVSPTQGGSFFTLDPSHTTIDAPSFLRAMKGYFEGKDWRGPEYAASPEQPHLPQGKAIKRIDLRSADARQARMGGLQVQKMSRWVSEADFESYDYGYEFSKEFMADCNDFLGEIVHFSFRTLRDAYEGEYEEESLLAAAEANEWFFTNTGAYA